MSLRIGQAHKGRSRQGTGMPFERAEAGPYIEGQDNLDRRIVVQASSDYCAIELRRITVRYKALTALSAVDLQIREGEFFSLLGPSGCGKTTTLNVIGGFVKPDEGQVLIAGQAVNHMPPYRRPVNTVFQSYALFPHMTVAENVAFGPRMAGMPTARIRERTKEALALVSLVDLGSRRPDQLSGGQQQRVALARALVNRPSVLLLDEPLGALDLKLRKQMQLELGRIQREVGITFVYVTHDQDEAMTMSDRIAVMDRGVIVQVGTPQEIYDQPATLFVADFIGTSNVFHGRVQDYLPEWVVVQLDAGQMIYVPRNLTSNARERVSVVVRPDHMALCNSPQKIPGTNAIPGRITKVSYLGTHLHITVATLGHGDLTVIEPLSPGERRNAQPEISSEVQVTWPAARSLCFPEKENELGRARDDER